MFGPDFYPTPRTIAKKMLAKISQDAVHFLEPSAVNSTTILATKG